MHILGIHFINLEEEIICFIFPGIIFVSVYFYFQGVYIIIIFFLLEFNILVLFVNLWNYYYIMAINLLHYYFYPRKIPFFRSRFLYHIIWTGYFPFATGSSPIFDLHFYYRHTLFSLGAGSNGGYNVQK